MTLPYGTKALYIFRRILNDRIAKVAGHTAAVSLRALAVKRTLEMRREI